MSDRDLYDAMSRWQSLSKTEYPTDTNYANLRQAVLTQRTRT